MIETILADLKEDVPTLRRYGAEAQAEGLERALGRIETELQEYLTWHDEAGATLLSGKPAGYFKARFGEWERRGLAQHRGRGKRYYRQAVIPMKPDVPSLVEDARRTARAETESAA